MKNVVIGRRLLVVALPLLLAAELGSTQPDQDSSRRKPNVILLMADDMGFSDIGSYGGEIRTPNLDRLADQGLRFTQFYNTGRCSPTRASLLTGLYPHQAGMGHMPDDYAERVRETFDSPAYTDHLSEQVPTIAEVLRDAGYRTWMTGKWHIGHVRPYWPVDRGFDRSFSLISGSDNYFRPVRTWAVDEQEIRPNTTDFYATDYFSDRAASLIRDHGSADEPFFLYVPYNAPHWPLHAPEVDIAKYRDQYRKGWDAIRQARYGRLLDMGIVDQVWELSPRDADVAAWEDAEQAEAWPAHMRTYPNQGDWVEATDRELWIEMMAVYAAMIDRLDQGIGRILDAVADAGKEDNTLVLFLADNGGSAERPARGDRGVWPGPANSFLGYGAPWSNVSNTPFRYHKRRVHEGGIASPLIAHWPAGVRSQGEITHQYAHLIDIAPTILDAAGVAYPSRFRGETLAGPEGRSLRPVFEGRRRQTPMLFWEHEGNRAVRNGKWKLVSAHPNGWELYDMETDRTELNDLSGTYPERIREMETLYEEWAARVGAKSWDLLDPTSR